MTVVVPLRHLAEVLVSNVDKKSVEGEQPVRLCNYTDVYYNDRITPDIDFMSASAAPEQVRKFALRAGDSVITKDSETADDIAVAAFVPDTLPGVVCAYHLAIVRGRANSIEPRYLAWALQSDYMRDQFSVRATGVTRYGLGYEAVRGADVPLVGDLAVQRRVADFLDEQVSRMDGAVAIRRAQREHLQERVHGAIRGILVGDAGRLLGHSPWFSALPSDRSAVPLRAGWRVIDCKHRTPTYTNDGFPVISPGDVAPGRLNLSRAHRFVGPEDFVDLADPTRRCLRGDLVYSRNASVGTAAYVETDEPFTMGQDVCRVTSSENNQLYLMYVLNFLVEPQLDSLRIGSTFTRINVAQIKSLRVPVPEPRRQRALAAECDEVAADTAAAKQLNESSIRSLGQRKRALITAAVTGEFDVSAASTRAAEAVVG